MSKAFLKSLVGLAVLTALSAQTLANNPAPSVPPASAPAGHGAAPGDSSSRGVVYAALEERATSQGEGHALAANPASDFSPKQKAGGAGYGVDGSTVLLISTMIASLATAAWAMQHFARTRTIRVRILCNSAVLLLILVVMTGYVIVRFVGVKARLATIAEDDLPILTNLADSESRMLEQALSLQKYRATGEAKYLERFEKQATSVENELATVEQEIGHAVTAANSRAERREFEDMKIDIVKLQADHEQFHATGRQFIAALQCGDRQAAISLADVVAEVEMSMRAEFGKLIKEAKEQAIHETHLNLATVSEIQLSLIAVGIGALVIGVGSSLLMTRALVKVLDRITSVLSAGATQTSSAAGQVSTSSQTLAEGATEQAASLEETSSALEEMSSMTRKNAESAQQASVLSGEAQQSAGRGTQAMERMSAAINDIQKSAAQTAKIIKVIDEIAFQTNLLALNAAVEAARAGEAGKGFAVVAEEVRNLAMRSAEAAKNTSALIEESVQNARNGVSIATDVGGVLEEIVGASTKVNALIGEIAAAGQEQSQGISQVNSAVAQMGRVTQENAANAEESASASEELAAQAAQLTSVVGELMKLVGSANAPAPSAAEPRVLLRRPASRPGAPSARGRQPNTTTLKSRASQAIPFDDDGPDGSDFSDFNRAA